MISVLLVDPHDDSRELYATVLQSLGFRVHATSNTDDACESLSLADVLVTGLQVPGRIDGVGLIRRLRNHPATHKIPIVVLTASRGSGTRASGAHRRLRRLPHETLSADGSCQRDPARGDVALRPDGNAEGQTGSASAPLAGEVRAQKSRIVRFAHDDAGQGAVRVRVRIARQP